MSRESSPPRLPEWGDAEASIVVAFRLFVCSLSLLTPLSLTHTHTHTLSLSLPVVSSLA